MSKFDESGIRVDTDGYTQLQVFIKTHKGRYKCGFRVDCVDVESREWMFCVLEKQFNEAFQKGVKQGEYNVRKFLQSALGDGKDQGE